MHNLKLFSKNCTSPFFSTSNGVYLPEIVVLKNIFVYLNFNELHQCARVSHFFYGLTAEACAALFQKCSSDPTHQHATMVARYLKRIDYGGCFFMKFIDIFTEVHPPIYTFYYSPNQLTVTQNDFVVGTVNTHIYGLAVVTTEEFTHMKLHVPQGSYLLIVSGELLSIIWPDKITVVYSAIRTQALLSWKIITTFLNEMMHAALQAPALQIPQCGGFWVGSNTVSLVVPNALKTMGITITKLNGNYLFGAQRSFNQLYLLYTIALYKIEKVCYTLDIRVNFNGNPEISPMQWNFPF